MGRTSSKVMPDVFGQSKLRRVRHVDLIEEVAKQSFRPAAVALLTSLLWQAFGDDAHILSGRGHTCLNAVHSLQNHSSSSGNWLAKRGGFKQRK